MMADGHPLGISFAQTQDSDSTDALTVIRVVQVQAQSVAAIAGVQAGDELVAVGHVGVGLRSPHFRDQVSCGSKTEKTL